MGSISHCGAGGFCTQCVLEQLGEEVVPIATVHVRLVSMKGFGPMMGGCGGGYGPMMGGWCAGAWPGPYCKGKGKGYGNGKGKMKGKEKAPKPEKPMVNANQINPAKDPLAGGISFKNILQ